MSTSASPERPLSALQKRILLSALAAKNGRRTPVAGHKTRVVSRALDRLITRGLVIGMGVKTAQKWYITGVRLTPAGRRAARALAGQQQRLPLAAS
ncbi:MAG: hypothetical protein AAB974_03445 [Patescibacteria group bacterium]